MQTQCISEQLRFEGLDGRRVEAAFDGGAVTSDAGALLLRETDRAIGLIDRLAACFRDGRDAGRVVHSLRTLIGQRIIGLALGYEDVNDHDSLRFDPALALFSDRLEPRRPDCAALGGKSTLNRLEHAPRAADDRYRKIAVDRSAVESLLVDLFLDAHAKPPKEIVLDLDATDDPLHGHQEGRFFHGYYDGYCYLPLYVFCGRHLLAAKLRRSNIDASAGSVEEVGRIVDRIRARWPRVRIVRRADAGFAREALMAWCEGHRVDYVFGLARNSRLLEALAINMAWAEDEHEKTGQAVRWFKDFRYATLATWSRRRRVIGKAEHLAKGANPRFVVTSLKCKAIDAKTLYEQVYCARGEMENRIKEQQLDLFADRTSTATIAANQLRLWFSSFAYVLMAALRRIGLQHTELEAATCGTLRLKLLKIGARVTVSVRRIKVAMASGCPSQAVFALAHARLRAPPA
ncbi:MAG: IS1380 family transposase [Rhodospirillales bacterium]